MRRSADHCLGKQWGTCNVRKRRKETNGIRDKEKTGVTMERSGRRIYHSLMHRENSRAKRLGHAHSRRWGTRGAVTQVGMKAWESQMDENQTMLRCKESQSPLEFAARTRVDCSGSPHGRIRVDVSSRRHTRRFKRDEAQRATSLSRRECVYQSCRHFVDRSVLASRTESMASPLAASLPALTRFPVC